MIVYLRMFGFVAAAAAVVVLGGARAAASPKGDVTCASGSVASGIYSSLKIAGACAIDAGSNGSVTVTGMSTRVLSTLKRGGDCLSAPLAAACEAGLA